jgi:ATP phosphoribosyltransferase regulatory subunit
VTEHVLIDLTMIGDFSYYTGMTFEGYAADLGFPVVSGGRYDNLLAQFGRPAPATGFALKTTRFLALVDGGADESGRGRTLIGYDTAGRAAALAAAGRLRAEGRVAVTARMSAAEADALERAQRERQGGGPILYNGAAYERFERFVGPAGAGGDGGGHDA